MCHRGRSRQVKSDGVVRVGTRIGRRKVSQADGYGTCPCAAELRCARGANRQQVHQARVCVYDQAGEVIGACLCRTQCQLRSIRDEFALVDDIQAKRDRSGQIDRGSQRTKIPCDSSDHAHLVCAANRGVLENGESSIHAKAAGSEGVDAHSV